MNVTIKRGNELLPAAWNFATWAEVGLLQGWPEFLRTDSSQDMRDSAEFARQAVTRWQSYADKSLSAGSVEDVRKRNAMNPEEEFAVLLVLNASWWFRPEHPLAFAYFRRTWCGGFYLEFMAGHPLTEGKLRGIIRATMRGLVSLARAGDAEWVWWEATKDSYWKYQEIVGEQNALSALQPSVKDVCMVRTADLESLLNADDKAISPP